MTFQLDERFEHHMEDVEDLRLHYVRGGTGPTLVLLHGWGSTWYMWRHLLSKLADHYDVIAPDIRGLGDSGVPQKPLNGYDKKTVAKDIRQLLDKLGVEKAHIMGHDHGAATAYAFCAQYRDVARSLIFCDMALMGMGGETGLEYFMNHGDQLRLWHISFHAANHVAEMLIRGKEREYLRYMYRTQIYNVDAISDEDIEVYARSYAAPGGLRLELYRSFYQDAEDFREFAKNKLTIPVLAVGGQQSIRELCAGSMRMVAENVEGVVIPRCGHWVPEERPAELLAHVLPFLKSAEQA
ncbi:alpha/beta fold hydrolase [Sphingobium sp. 15-1]|uniref:alpha/beta fold hydrolase n=1 Tax=Sphingobium sp. 15-1 TaxID=2729616 RepID=UPI001C3FA2BE|nr:alpha/beta hydrolase [Sphingobium sp. 15-1]